MKLVQKILSHGLFIAFVVAAFFIFTKRAELFPQWFAKSGSPVQVAAGEKAPTTAAQSVSRPKPEKVISKQPVMPLEEPPAASGESVAPVNAPAGESEADVPPQAPPAADTPATDETAAGSAADNMTGAPDSAAEPALQPPSAMPALQETPVQQPASAEMAAADTPAAAQASGDVSSQQAAEDGAQLQQQLAQARVLFWRKDTSGAALIYSSLTQAHPHDADVWGEAGNFYYSLQQREQAADAYAHAIDLLMQQGEQQRASQLLGVMHQLDENKARALETQLQQSGG